MSTYTSTSRALEPYNSFYPRLHQLGLSAAVRARADSLRRSWCARRVKQTRGRTTNVADAIIIMKHDHQGGTETYRFVSRTLDAEQGELNVRCLQQFIVDAGRTTDACAVRFADAVGFLKTALHAQDAAVAQHYRVCGGDCSS